MEHNNKTVGDLIMEGISFFNKNDILLYAPFTGGPSYFSPLLSSFVIKSNKYSVGKFKVGNSIYDIFNLDMIQKKYGEINSIILWSNALM